MPSEGRGKERKMITEIGVVSGEILSYIEEEGRAVNLKTVLLHLDEPKDIILMSIGWLIREGFVHVEKLNGDYLISTLANHYTARRSFHTR
jgi:hypothetical protein